MNSKEESLLLKKLIENYTSLENRVLKLEIANNMQAEAIIGLLIDIKKIQGLK